MIKLDIVNAVVERTGISKLKVDLAVATIFSALTSALKNGDRIELRGFGVFEIRARKTGIGRNPKTGELVPLQPGKTVKFKPGKDIRSL